MEFRDQTPDPLEALLDEQSDGEFGEPEIRDRNHHHADANKSGALSKWSAEEFASIYTRFRPHLVRHARRYLSTEVQAEEVVQDAFLYLMTTLPELDNELGVLKFLKWKIRLLSLDILGSAQTKREFTVGDHYERQGEADEVTVNLERAEDNAVIRLALAQLSPRHREALVASVYEEKSAEEVANQMDLTPNAARQLLFRARSAFKTALVGEAELKGKSVSEILSVAAKKAALDAKNNVTKIGIFLVAIAISIGVGSNFVQQETVILSSFPQTPESQAPPENPQSDSVSSAEAGQDESPRGTPSDVSTPESSNAEPTVPESAEQETYQVDSQNLTSSNSATGETEASNPAPQTFVLPASTSSQILTTNVTEAGVYQNSYAAILGEFFQGTSIEVFGGTGISAFLDYDSETQSVSQILFQLRVGGEPYVAVARNWTSATGETEQGNFILISASDFYVVSDSLGVFSDSPLAESEASIRLELDRLGNPGGASLKFGQN